MSLPNSVFSLDSTSPNRIGFDLARVMRTNYRIDDFQESYFVLGGLDELLALAHIDFLPLYERVEGLAEFEPEETLHVQGASFLIDELAGEVADRQRTLETLRVLFRLIEEKHQLIELLSRSIEAGGLTVVIGSENLSPELRPFSLVVSTFQDGDRVGTIGVIGPTRMRYQRAISMVDGVSHAVTRLLESQ